jgi:hypothetical protein
MVSTTSMVLITGAAVVATALLTAALLALLVSRLLQTQIDAAGDQMALKVRSAITEAVAEELPRVREVVEGGVRDAADGAVPRIREQVRDGVSEAIGSAMAGGVLGEAGEELVRKGGGVLDVLLGSRSNDE